MARPSPDRAQLVDRFLAADSSFNGRFVAAITTTGIYCLPSCPAKKAKAENIRLFRDLISAQRAGFRACLRCRPDDFYAKHDPQRSDLEQLFERAQAQLESFPDVEALASASGYSTTRFNALVRDHYHTTPAALLRRWRLASAAKRLLSSDEAIADIAFASGFESLSPFHENFRRAMAMAPGDYRKLARGASDFTLTLPADFRSQDVVRYIGRINSEGDARTIIRAIALSAGVSVLRISLRAGAARCELRGAAPHSAEDAAMVHSMAVRMLGLRGDPDAFEQWIGRQSSLRRLIAGRSGVRNPSTPTNFEALAWSIIGQQVNVAFATALQNDLVELCGPRAATGERAYPSAADVARLDYADLTTRRFSRSKARYLIDSARLVESGELDLEALAAGSASGAREALLAVRGIGPWSANYIMMRGFGFEDCAPIGDTGLSSGLQTFFRLASRPSAKETEELMRRFAPFRTYATLHLWMTKHESESNQ